jgi:hypothetical protein
MKNKLVVFLIAALALLLLPLLAQSVGNFWVRMLDFALLYVLLALGLNIVVGYAGLLDLGYVAFYAVGDRCDPSTREGDMMLTMRAMLAKEEHSRIRDRTVGIRNAMRASGLYIDPVPPRGYRIEACRLVVDEEGAAIVRAVFQESILGRSVTRTAKAYGLDRKTVHFILRNRYYLGETRDGRGGWMRGTHEALITPDVWQRARDASESRRLGGVRPRLITSGATSTWILRTVAHCGACCARMTSAYHKNRDGETARRTSACATSRRSPTA